MRGSSLAIGVVSLVVIAACGGAGSKGDIGAAGPQGAQGDRGPAGPQALQGDAGPIGPSGPQGPQGAMGAQGPLGLQGPQGAPGLAWRGVWSSAVVYAPSDAVSSDGSSYVAILPNTNVAPPSVDWLLLAAKGDAGAQGAQGPMGPQGDLGPLGPQGPQGDAGAQGPVGPQGAFGPMGLQGLKGDAGAQGPIGPQGAQGPPGVTDAAATLFDVTTPALPTSGSLVVRTLPVAPGSYVVFAKLFVFNQAPGASQVYCHLLAASGGNLIDSTGAFLSPGPSGPGSWANLSMQGARTVSSPGDSLTVSCYATAGSQAYAQNSMITAIRVDNLTTH